MSGLGWLGEYSEEALRSALRVVDAGLASGTIELTGTNDLSRPTWASGSAMIDGCMLAKFAFSEPTAVRLCTRRACWSCSAPARSSTFLDWWPPARGSAGNELRARLTPVIEPRQRALVHCWCDWIDGQLARASDPVFVHGDFHGYNQLWDQWTLRLRLVADFETSGAAESRAHHGIACPHRSWRRLWRTEAGLPLLLARPGGGHPADYVQELSERFALLGIDP
jgi:Phosphotransferase enzyme family